MTRREHGFLTALTLLGLLLALYQCWYVSLPTDRAAAFDLCRWTAFLDCYESLNRFGASILWVFTSSAALFGFMFALCGFAWTAAPENREAWLGVVRLAAYPAAGLAIYVIANDLIVARATSPSAMAVGLVAVTLAVLTVVRGLQGARLRDGARWTLAIAGGAALFGFFLQGAVGARREIARLDLERAEAPPQIRWAEFEPDIPRAGAASLGDPLAPKEGLVFVDPQQEASRRLMAEIANLDRKDVLFYFYAPGDDGARMILASRKGELKRYLLDPLGYRVTGIESVRAFVAWQEKAADVKTYPTVISKRGRQTGDIDLLRAFRDG